ncbi:hypothetical protein ACFQL4_24700 [Halosimplex aquaticum]
MPRSLPGSTRGEIYVALGFALLLNPFVVGAFDVGDPDSYTYEPKEITFYDNGTVDRPAGVRDVDPAVACFEALPQRTCMLERAIRANGGVRYDGLSSTFLRHDYQYVYVYGEGFFAPVADDLGNDTVEYTIRPVSQSAALDSIAEPSSDASRGVRTALETGEYRTSDPLDGANELVTHDGDYYVVSMVSSRTTTGGRRTSVVALQWALGSSAPGSSSADSVSA